MTPLVLGLAMAQVVGLAADLRTTFLLSDYSEASLRPGLRPPGAPGGDALDLETTPRGTLKFDWDKSNVSLGYGPRLMLRDVLQERAELVLHGAYVGYSHTGPRYQLTLTESASYGWQTLINLSFLAPAAVSPIGPGTQQGSPATTGGATQGSSTPPSSPALTQLGRVQSVKVASELTSATLDYAWSRRWGSRFNASYGISGGLNDDAQNVLPRQYAAGVGASLDYAVTRDDTLITSVGIGNTLVSNGFNNWLVTATEGWKHRLTRELKSTVSAGVAWYTSKGPIGERDSGLYPVASLGLEGGWTIVRRRAYVVSLQAGSTVVPAVNIYTGQLQERASAFSTLGISNKKSSLSGTVSGSQTFPPLAPDAVGLFGMGVLATHQPAKFIEISAGYRVAWQNPNTLPVPRMWTAFLGLALYAPPVRF